MIPASDSRSDLRPSGACPLCGDPSRLVDSFEFAPSRDLPQVVRLEFCDACNFMFVGGVHASAYRRYYETVQNDAGNVASHGGPHMQVALQAAHLDEFLPPGFDGRILDFGCGQGHLLQALAERFPRARLWGHDVADYLSDRSRIGFLAALDDVQDRFDVIILSHVVEHLVEFDIVRRLETMLAPGGVMYIEVPDPRSYVACPRREFMYYVDRLHINHFSLRAMRRFLDRFGLRVRRTGTHRFQYRDGLYPAMFCIAERAHVGAPVEDDQAFAAESDEESLDEVYRGYLADEERRARGTRQLLRDEAGADGILVYGAGDNFWRSRRAGGPLHALSLLAVMDRRAAELPVASGLLLLSPTAALHAFSDEPVVITISQQAEAVAEWIRERSPGRRIFFV